MSETIEIPKGWELKKISQSCDIVRGSSPRPKGDPHYFGGSIPWIKISDVTRNEGKFLKETKEGLTEAGVPKSRFLKSGTLILTNSATICLPKILKIDGCIHDGFLAFLNLKEIDRDFLYYFFLAYRTKITETVARGLAQKNLNIDLVSNIEILLPPILIQKKIVQKLDDILGQFEEKKKEILSLIEQNKERINFFEKNWMSYVIDREIEKHPQSNEWKMKTLSQVCTINPSKSEIKDLPDETLVSFIPMRNVDDKDGIIKIHDEELLGKVRKGFTYFRNNDVIFAKITPCMENGKIAIGVDLKNDIGFGSTEFHVLRPHEEILSEFIHYFLRNLSFRMEAKENFTGSAGQQRVPKDFIENHIIPVPKISTQKQIIQNIKNAEEKFQLQKKQFENIKNNYESKIKYINHIQSSILDSAFSGKLLN